MLEIKDKRGDLNEIARAMRQSNMAVLTAIRALGIEEHLKRASLPDPALKSVPVDLFPKPRKYTDAEWYSEDMLE